MPDIRQKARQPDPANRPTEPAQTPVLPASGTAAARAMRLSVTAP